MNKYDIYIREYGILLDCITLILCSVLVARSVLDTGSFLIRSVFLNEEVVYNVLLIIAAIKLYFCFDIYDKKYISAVVLLLLTIILYKSGIADFRYLIYPMVALFEVSFENIVKVFAATSGFCLVVILITSLTGNIQNATVLRGGSAELVAYQLGFSHHSWFMMHYLFAMFALIYIIRKSRIRLFIYSALLIITVILWNITDSNTSGIVGVMVCFGMILDYIVRLMIRPVRPAMRMVQDFLMKTSIVMPLLCAILSVLGCLYMGFWGYGPFPVNFMNRFRLILTALEAMGVQLPFSVTEQSWDIPFNWAFGTGRTVTIGQYDIDNVYAKLLIENGLIILTAYLIIQMIVRYNLYKKKQYALALMCFWVSIFGILESRSFTTFSCALFSMLLFTRVPRIIRGRKNRHKKIMRTER